MRRVSYRQSTPGRGPSYWFRRPANYWTPAVVLVFGMTQERRIDGGHEELMRKGKEGRLAVGTLTSRRGFLE